MAYSQKAGHKKLNVFISYSRQDIEFVDRLQAALKNRGIEAFVDRRDIEKAEEWWARIKQLITEADTIVFTLSPGSVNSRVCNDEVDSRRSSTSASCQSSLAISKGAPCPRRWLASTTSFSSQI